MQIKLNNLVKIYLSLFITLFIILIDKIFLGGRLLSMLPSSPEGNFWYLIFFVTPHIHVSFISLFDKNIVKQFYAPLIIGVPIIFFTCFTFPIFFSEKLFMCLVGIWTAKHLVYQQFAITPFFTLTRDKTNRYWEWMAVLLTVFLYLTVFPDESYFKADSFLKVLFYILIVPFLIATIIVSSSSKTKGGQVFVWLNFSMVFLGTVECLLGYGFFSILSLRIIHDITAVYFYNSYYQNKVHSDNNNFILNFFKLIPFPIWISAVLFGVFTALPFRFIEENHWVLYLLTAMGTSHYYLDSIQWKKNSPFRSFIKISEVR